MPPSHWISCSILLENLQEIVIPKLTEILQCHSLRKRFQGSRCFNPNSKKLIGWSTWIQESTNLSHANYTISRWLLNCVTQLNFTNHLPRFSPYFKAWRAGGGLLKVPCLFECWIISPIQVVRSLIWCVYQFRHSLLLNEAGLEPAQLCNCSSYWAILNKEPDSNRWHIATLFMGFS